MPEQNVSANLDNALSQIIQESMAQVEDSTDSQESNQTLDQKDQEQLEDQSNSASSSEKDAQKNDSSNKQQQMEKQEDDDIDPLAPEEFRDSKRWKQIYLSHKKVGILENQLEQLKSQLESKSLQNLKDEELYRELRARELQDQNPAKKTEKESFESQFDTTQMTPEQLEVHNYVTTVINEQLKQMLDKRISPLSEKINKYDQMIENQRQDKRINELKSSQDEARKWVKDQYNIDYDSDVAPKIRELIAIKSKNNPYFGADLDVMDLTKMVLSDGLLLNIGKRKGQEEISKINKQKQQKQVESGESNGKNANLKIDYSKIPFDRAMNAIIRESMKIE